MSKDSAQPIEITVQSHNANVSDAMRLRAQRAVRRLARRISRAVSASIRFEEDGPEKRVEVIINTSRVRPLVAHGEARFYGSALALALSRAESQASRLKVTPREKARRSDRR